MKAKWLAIALTTLALTATSAFAFTACGGGNDDGPDTGLTDDDNTGGNTNNENNNNNNTENNENEGGNGETPHEHSYGEWKITEMPTKDGAGKAQKICSGDSTHVVSVDLPKFDRAGKSEYSSYVEDGSYITFTYAHELGNISAKTIASLKDAIDIGVENMEAVVSGTASCVFDYKVYSSRATGDVTFEFGEDRKYLHLNDGPINSREYFYELNDDGTMFPVYTEPKTIFKDGQDMDTAAGDIVKTNFREVLNMKEATPEMMGGFGYFFTWLDGSHKEYGIEKFIDYIYESYYSVNGNKDAACTVKVNDDGSLQFNMSVSVHAQLQGDTYNEIAASFTLDEDGVMRKATALCRTWNNAVQDAASGKWSAPAGEQYKVMDSYSVTQNTEYDGAVPTNPYSLETMQVTSYDLKYDGNDVAEGQEVEIDANSFMYFTLENIAPADTFNFNFDELDVKVTYLDAAGEEKEKQCVASATDLTDGEILAQFIPRRSYDGTDITTEYTLQFKSLLAGEFNVTIKSAKVTKTIKLKVNTIAPSAFGTTVYEYNPNKNVWETDDISSEFTVYEGQAFNFASYVAHPNYEESGFTYTVERGEDTGFESDYSIADATVDGASKKFVATVAGDYTITLTNLKANPTNGNPITAQVTVHVVQAPDMAEVLVGKYFNLDQSIELTFTPSSAGATSGTATLVTGVGGKRPTTTELSYSYTNGYEVELTYVSGASYKTKDGNDDSNFRLTFDDAYNMFVSYDTSMGTERRVYLYNVEPNLIEGTYRITAAASSAVKLVVNISGKYTVTADSYSGVYYGIFNAKNGRQIGDNVSLSSNSVIELEVGQYLCVWTIGTRTDTNGNPIGTNATQYTVTFVPETSEPDSSEPDEE